MRVLSLCSAVFTALLMSACAHPIVISPAVDKIAPSVTAQKINKNVAYYIADDILRKEVITPGGGGDKVSYMPYRDIENGFYKMLSNTFSSVTKLKSLNDSDAISKNSVSYIITPSLVTNSSSPSPFTWPPTKFNAELTCSISDAAGKTILVKKASGDGSAEFDEFKRDHSLSGKRASEDVLVKMQKMLLEAPELQK
ncbi:hypothetical protein [Undibacterium sp. RuTC16W]|uniref:hypothetical protein n=1 Tax=Undibacterium sp. RuTC16W TaxID=3413048 RepID=UPI003BF16AC7